MSNLAVKLPITRDDVDGYAMISDFQTLIRQNLKMIILTDKGERVMIPSFGVGIRTYLFENFNTSIFVDIENDIREQAAIFLPVITVDSVLFDDTEKDFNKLGIAIVYRIPSLGLKDLLQFTI